MVHTLRLEITLLETWTNMESWSTVATLTLTSLASATPKILGTSNLREPKLNSTPRL